VNEIDVIRKAAVLVASLERDAADVLLEQLEPAQAESIRHAVMSMPEIDGREEAETIREFLGARNGSFNGRAESGDPSLATTEPTASKLDQASDQLIADCLSDEMPQTIAVALSQLPAQRASEVVTHLPAHVQTQVLERLVELEPSGDLEKTDVRDEFQDWLNQQIERSMHRAQMASRLATILDATNSPTRQRILENVAINDTRLAAELRHRVEDASA